MRKKPDWGEPMPFRFFDFTPEQEAVIRRIEDITQAEVIIIAPFPQMMSSYDHGGRIAAISGKHPRVHGDRV